MDEAEKLARDAFRAVVAQHLSGEEIEEVREHGAKTCGTVEEGIWDSIIGHAPDRNQYYQFEIYRRADTCPYIEKSFVKILIPRDRSTESVHFIWRPIVPVYTGPYFE
jgi:hypothetical protein